MAAEYGPDAVLFHARQGDIDEVKRLVAENRSMANYTHVVTPLMWASYMGHTTLATYLLEHGARVNQVEMGKGRTALYLAAGRGHAAMVSLLLKRGADPGIRRSGGWDALSVAASEAHIEVVQLLLDEAGVEVDGCDADGCTALHRASAWGRTEVVRLLLRRGADWRRTTHGKTPLDMARERHRAECIVVLEDAERAYELRRVRQLMQHSGYLRSVMQGTTSSLDTCTNNTNNSQNSGSSNNNSSNTTGKHGAGWDGKDRGKENNSHSHSHHRSPKRERKTIMPHPDDVVTWLRKRVTDGGKLPAVHIGGSQPHHMSKHGWWSRLFGGRSSESVIPSSASEGDSAAGSASTSTSTPTSAPAAAMEYCVQHMPFDVFEKLLETLA